MKKNLPKQVNKATPPTSLDQMLAQSIFHNMFADAAFQSMGYALVMSAIVDDETLMDPSLYATIALDEPGVIKKHDIQLHVEDVPIWCDCAEFLQRAEDVKAAIAGSIMRVVTYLNEWRENAKIVAETVRIQVHMTNSHNLGFRLMCLISYNPPKEDTDGKESD